MVVTDMETVAVSPAETCGSSKRTTLM